MHCLWCNSEIIPELNWNNLLVPDPVAYLCKTCEEGLEILHGDVCNMCGRLSRQKFCGDCQNWQHDPYLADVLLFNQSVYVYNSQMQEMLAKWKYRGDYVLCHAFAGQLQKRFQKTFSKALRKEAVLVPIPLSERRLYERSFNQAEALAGLLNMPVVHALSRKHGEKQSKKTRRERLATVNPFQLEKSIDKPVILIDDIYTTGTTIRHAAKQLKTTGCPAVYSFTLAR